MCTNSSSAVQTARRTYSTGEGEKGWGGGIRGETVGEEGSWSLTYRKQSGCTSGCYIPSHLSIGSTVPPTEASRMLPSLSKAIPRLTTAHSPPILAHPFSFRLLPSPPPLPHAQLTPFPSPPASSIAPNPLVPTPAHLHSHPQSATAPNNTIHGPNAKTHSLTALILLPPPRAASCL